MNLNALHKRLLQDVLEIGNAFPFVITGGYAVQAHGLVDRLSRDIDVATNGPVPMSSLADNLVAALTERGWQVRVIGVDPISARFMVTDLGTGEDCEVDILKEGFNLPPQATPYGPVLREGMPVGRLLPHGSVPTAAPGVTQSGCCRRCRCHRNGSAGLLFLRCGAPSGTAMGGPVRRGLRSRPDPQGLGTAGRRPSPPGPVGAVRALPADRTPRR